MVIELSWKYSYQPFNAERLRSIIDVLKIVADTFTRAIFIAKYYWISSTDDSDDLKKWEMKAVMVHYWWTCSPLNCTAGGGGPVSEWTGLELSDCWLCWWDTTQNRRISRIPLAHALSLLAHCRSLLLLLLLLVVVVVAVLSSAPCVCVWVFVQSHS